MKNCEHCRWRKDLVKIYYHEDGMAVRTHLDGFACIAWGDILWINNISAFQACCEYFDEKEEEE